MNILDISLLEHEEPVSVIYKKATEIINIVEQSTQQLIKEGIDFETAEKLKLAKKSAKQILQNKDCSLATQSAMKRAIRQYDNIVESVYVLQTLRQISREIRSPKKIAEHGEELRPTAGRFFDVLGGDNAVYDLVEVYDKSKEGWKQKWTEIRKNMWNASMEAESLIKNRRKITFISGSKSSSIPTIINIGKLAPILSTKAALVPTGQLLQHKIVPLSGELNYGITKNGVNQTSLSGCQLEGLNICINYASAKSFQFDADKELDNIIKIEKVDDILTISKLRIAVLRLLRMKAKTEEYDKIKKLITLLINQQPAEEGIAPLWPQPRRRGAR